MNTAYHREDNNLLLLILPHDRFVFIYILFIISISHYTIIKRIIYILFIISISHYTIIKRIIYILFIISISHYTIIKRIIYILFIISISHYLHFICLFKLFMCKWIWKKIHNERLLMKVIQETCRAHQIRFLLFFLHKFHYVFSFIFTYT
jgi:hypothetical protein